MIHQVAFSPDGERLASLDVQGGVRLWDARTGAEQPRFLPPGVRSLGFCADGKRVAVVAGPRLTVWDVVAGRESYGVREIGNGATSRVYLARDPFLGRDVAIKVLEFARDADLPDHRVLADLLVERVPEAGMVHARAYCAMSCSSSASG